MNITAQTPMRAMNLMLVKKFITKPGRAAAAPSAGQAEGGVAGSLADMSFADLVQMVTASAKTMTITVTSGDKNGEVVVVSGEVVDAKVDNLTGEQAFYAMMGWQEGTFATRRSAECASRTIRAPVMSLLMEGARLVDEGAAAAAKP